MFVKVCLPCEWQTLVRLHFLLGSSRVIRQATSKPACRVTCLPAFLFTCLPALQPTNLPTYPPSYSLVYLPTVLPTYLLAILCAVNCGEPARLPGHNVTVHNLSVAVYTCADNASMSATVQCDNSRGYWQLPDLPCTVPPFIASESLFFVGFCSLT